MAVQTKPTRRRVQYPSVETIATAALKDESLRYQLRLGIAEPATLPSDIQTLHIGEKLSELLKRDLTFQGQKTAYASHNIHAFAAKFPPQIPRLFIRELTLPGESVLDPMSGSGTNACKRKDFYAVVSYSM